MSGEICVEFYSKPTLKDPVLICGLPGSGYVGKLAVDYLIDKLEAKKLADIYSSSFPPQVTIQSDGTLDLVKNSLFYTSEPVNLVLLAGDTQPVSAQGEYALADQIQKICQEMGIKEIFTLAAYITGKFTKTPRVYATSTSYDYVQEFPKHNILTMDKGTITGMNGLIIGRGKKYSIRGSCLLGETSGYVVDANASKAVLESLSNLIGIEIDMQELEKRAKDTEEIIKALQSQAAASNVPQNLRIPQTSAEKNLGYIS